MVQSFLAMSPLCHATLAQRDIFLLVDNFCHGPQFPWVRDFLKMFLLSHATVARWDTFLQAAANFF
jgi:hypothetical protein